MKYLLMLTLFVLLFNFRAAQAAESKIDITDLHFVKSVEGQLYIEGLVKNLTAHPLRQVYVAFNLLKNGMVVGYSTDIVFDLQPRQAWQIHTRCRTRIFKPDHFRLAELSVIP
ncbi:FxLYD domain-containing protein [Franconibacter helveticus]|uniref:FxLYD domain-containing protein n=1 Tax=Franconibacter helveticus TaxID=357240 RepID=UPI00066DEA1F|nr:FxLYD domain-containing protein [Franconibacter helveticus]